MKLYFLLALLITHSAFGYVATNRTVKSGPSSSKGKVEIPVLFYIMTDNAGRGNDKWLTKDYTDKVIAEVNRIYDSRFVTFVVRAKYVYKDTDLYEKSQHKLLNKFNDYAIPGSLSIVISSEDYDGSSSGLTRGSITRAPLFIMRSRYNGIYEHGPRYFGSKQAINATALLITHELGHEMGLKHKEDIKRSKGEILHTENYVRPGKDLNLNGKGKKFYEKYFSTCIGNKNSRFGCQIPSIK